MKMWLPILMCTVLACAKSAATIDDAFIASLPTERNGVPIEYPEGAFDDVDAGAIRNMDPKVVARRFGKPVPFPLPPGELYLHVQPSGICPDISADAFRCHSVTTIADVTDTDLDVFLFAANVDSLAGVHFGIDYDETVQVSGFESCNLAGFLQIPTPDWPAAGSSAAFAFSPEPGIGIDRVIIIGKFRLAAGSVGTFRLTGLSRYPNESASFAWNARGGLFPPDCGLGAVSVGGEGEAANACGACR